MMGGSEWMKNINEKLVVVVREIGLVMVVGSIYVVLRNLCMVEIFMIVWKMNFEGMIFSNVGVDVLVEKILEVVELFEV